MPAPAEAARQVELYGDAATVDDVRFLRQQGFVVHREGAGVRIGNTLCTLAALRAKAARERRLLEGQAKAGGLAKGNQHTRPLGVAATPSAAPSLFEMGIDKDLAHRARPMAIGSSTS
jgi:hypothetical protein